jgi:uncharacterized protein
MKMGDDIIPRWKPRLGAGWKPRWKHNWKTNETHRGMHNEPKRIADPMSNKSSRERARTVSSKNSLFDWKGNSVKILLAIILLLLVMIIGAMEISPHKISKVCYAKNCFSVELAEDDTSRARGLMYRETLAQDRGMLFILPEESNYPFWMKNTMIPLDIIWIDENWNVARIASSVQPCKSEPCEVINPGATSRYVLELNSGTAESIGLKEGSRLSHN